MLLPNDSVLSSRNMLTQESTLNTMLHKNAVDMCWYGQLCFLTEHLKGNPEHELFQTFNKHDRKWGSRPFGKAKIDKALRAMCNYVGLDNAENVNNMWARKTFTTRAITDRLCEIPTVFKLIRYQCITHTVDIQLPAAQVMAVTGHKSEVQMRRDYLPPKHQKPK
jgi:hypothetical protein